MESIKKCMNLVKNVVFNPLPGYAPAKEPGLIGVDFSDKRYIVRQENRVPALGCRE